MSYNAHRTAAGFAVWVELPTRATTEDFFLVPTRKAALAKAFKRWGAAAKVLAVKSNVEMSDRDLAYFGLTEGDYATRRTECGGFQ